MGKYDRSTLKACITGMLEMCEQSGVPRDGQIIILTQWVMGIIEQEREHAVEEHTADQDIPGSDR